jgi:surface protein
MFSFMHLTSLDMSGWEMSKVTDMRSMFTSSTGITNLNMLGATLPDINLSNWGLGGLYNLSIDSLVSVLNALPTTTKGYTVNIGATNLSKLNDEQKSIATNKGWAIN